MPTSYTPSVLKLNSTQKRYNFYTDYIKLKKKIQEMTDKQQMNLSF